MGKLNAGDLREQVTLLLELPAGVSDGRGGTLPPTTARGEKQVWARVQPVSGSEVVRLGFTLPQAVLKVTLRYVAGQVSPATQLRWQGQSLNVQAVAVDEQKEYVVLTCLASG